MSQSTADMQVQLENVQADAEMYKDRLDSYENMSEYMRFVTVYADFDSQDITTRYIRIMGDDNEIKKITITPETEKEGYEAFETAFRELVSADTSVPVLYSLNHDQILYRDEVRLNEIFHEMNYPNLYYKETQE